MENTPEEKSGEVFKSKKETQLRGFLDILHKQFSSISF